LALVLVGAVIATWRWRGRAGKRWRREHGPEVEWEALRMRLPESMRWGAELTPHEAADLVSERLGEASAADNQPQVADAVSAITALSHAVADHRYAPSGTEVDADQLRAWADQVAGAAHTVSQAHA